MKFYKILFIAFTLSCSNRDQQDSKKQGLSSIPPLVNITSKHKNEEQIPSLYDQIENGKIWPIKIQPDSFINVQRITQWFANYIEVNSLMVKNIKIKYVGNNNSSQYGKLKIFDINLLGGWPGNMYKSYSLIYDTKDSFVYILPFEKIVFVKNNKYENNLFFGGYVTARRKELFDIFSFNGGKLERIFSTLNNCNHSGVIVSTNGMECIEYLPNRLHFSNIDINNDGYLDLKFSGKIYTKCDSLENELVQTIVKNMVIEYLYNKNKKNWYLKDSTDICKKIWFIKHD